MYRSRDRKLKRTFPADLHNKLEEKLKSIKTKDALINTDIKKTEDSNLIKCPKCGKMVEKDRVVKKKYICYECGGYFRVKTYNRIRMVADYKTFEPWFEDMEVSNPLNYEGYENKLADAREKTGLKEAVTVGKCKVFGQQNPNTLHASKALYQYASYISAAEIRIG